MSALRARPEPVTSLARRGGSGVVPIYLAVLVGVVLGASVAQAAGGARTLTRNGVAVTAPASWKLVPTVGEMPVTDPKTVLVVGSPGVKPSLTAACQIAAYDLPATGAVVVVVRWRTQTSGGGRPTQGIAALKMLATLERHTFECFEGRGAAIQLGLHAHAYQVNVMVGDRATSATIKRALAVAGSMRETKG